MVMAPRVSVRSATRDDVRFFYEVNNDPVTRAQAIQTAPIPWETHTAWFERKLADPESHLFVGCLGEAPIGVVRFELKTPGLLVSIALLPSWRGQGLAAPLLEAGTVAAFARGVQKIVAFVRPG